MKFEERSYGRDWKNFEEGEEKKTSSEALIQIDWVKTLENAEEKTAFLKEVGQYYQNLLQLELTL